MFYKPLTFINSFKSSGIYPVDSKVISDNQLKPGLTYVADVQNKYVEKMIEKKM